MGIIFITIINIITIILIIVIVTIIITIIITIITIIVITISITIIIMGSPRNPVDAGAQDLCPRLGCRKSLLSISHL